MNPSDPSPKGSVSVRQVSSLAGFQGRESYQPAQADRGFLRRAGHRDGRGHRPPADPFCRKRGNLPSFTAHRAGPLRSLTVSQWRNSRPPVRHPSSCLVPRPAAKSICGGPAGIPHESFDSNELDAARYDWAHSLGGFDAEESLVRLSISGSSAATTTSSRSESRSSAVLVRERGPWSRTSASVIRSVRDSSRSRSTASGISGIPGASGDRAVLRDGRKPACRSGAFPTPRHGFNPGRLRRNR